MPHTYEYPRPALTVDCVVFGLEEQADSGLRVLLIQRAHEPFAGCWALPGGCGEPSADLEDAARRELEEETSLQIRYLEQLYTFGTPNRDPRGWVVSVAWFALVQTLAHVPHSGSDASRAEWHPLAALPPLAFDHAHILRMAHQRLKAKIRYAPIGFELLPASFTLRQLQELYEIILETRLDKRNFRRKVLSMGVLEETGELEQDVAHRAARLYRFNEDRYRALAEDGFGFEI